MDPRGPADRLIGPWTAVPSPAPHQALAAAAGITSIPALMAFRDRTLVFPQPGALNTAVLEQVIEGVKNLDTASPVPRQHSHRAEEIAGLTGRAR